MAEHEILAKRQAPFFVYEKGKQLFKLSLDALWQRFNEDGRSDKAKDARYLYDEENRVWKKLGQGEKHKKDGLHFTVSDQSGLLSKAAGFELRLGERKANSFVIFRGQRHSAWSYPSPTHSAGPLALTDESEFELEKGKKLHFFTNQLKPGRHFIHDACLLVEQVWGEKSAQKREVLMQKALAKSNAVAQYLRQNLGPAKRKEVDEAVKNAVFPKKQKAV